MNNQNVHRQWPNLLKNDRNVICLRQTEDGRDVHSDQRLHSLEPIHPMETEDRQLNRVEGVCLSNYPRKKLHLL